jgi:hypothetical protein
MTSKTKAVSNIGGVMGDGVDAPDGICVSR